MNVHVFYIPEHTKHVDFYIFPLGGPWGLNVIISGYVGGREGVTVVVAQ